MSRCLRTAALAVITLAAPSHAAIALAAPSHAAAATRADYVHPLAGTEPGPGTFGGGHNFPGAALPFGMVQFSPDTTPAGHADGYDYRDSHIRGFSLTHLAGAGCSLYGDFPFLPTTQPLTASPALPGSAELAPQFEPGFSHANESASAGFYEVGVGRGRKQGTDARLTATTRTGLARFTFPRSPNASVLINAGGSANPDDHADVQVDPAAAEITGSASSGYFCAQRPRYRVYFAARFNRPFSSWGTWQEQTLSPGATAAADDKPVSTNASDTAQAGAYATFNTRRTRGVQVKVGISFVSVDGARRNLGAEQRGFNLGKVAGAARRTWNRALGSIKVSDGRGRDTATFYTALYHALLAPRTFNDVDGSYIGMDNQLHSTGGGTKYADISGWDIYRTQIQLLAILMPARASEIIRSLLTDAAESGCLPRWPYANGQSMTMVGDPSDPIIASAAAFGATDFDIGAALGAMVKGATQTCQSTNGSYLQRQGLGAYQALGYVPYDLDTNQSNANSIFGDPTNVWASAETTLEYQTADFSIAQFAARFARDSATYAKFMQRSGNWRSLLNPASRFIEPRYANGSFLSGYDVIHGGGFAEGSAAQYTWMVPFDPSGLAALIGGPEAAAGRLTYLLRILNSTNGSGTDHALLGNEPTLLTPWLFNWLGKPFETQAAVRRAVTQLYGPYPAGYPGNDDLGTLSSWYVFGALGMYPEVPGTGILALSSPLFPHARFRIGKKTVLIDAKGATPGTRFVRGLSLNGHRFAQPWTTYCTLARGARLRYSLSPRPKRKWGASAAALPPSYQPGRPMPTSPCAN
ncbi:MAG: GH92 family glycosyl hydrolase [Actinomycetota bacterium]|nr:GH92 family glycosyl hydrolase [Actinomycetota bacterium]